jgi:hypothetical protein
MPDDAYDPQADALGSWRVCIDEFRRQHQLRAPFPWFGGKSRVAAQVWEAFGRIDNYVEPFFGSGAVLLSRPEPIRGNETINDKDGFVSNFWRAIKYSPDKTAEWADWPVNENDLHARHLWLTARRDELASRLEGDPEFYDPKIAGWWVWGIACWIGGEFCSGKGPWGADDDGKLVHLGDSGQGVRRRLVHLGASGRGVTRRRVHLGAGGQGVTRKLVHLKNNGSSINGRSAPPLEIWFRAISERLAHVRVASGDWSRVCGPSVTFTHGTTGVFLDPPYGDASRDPTIYTVDSTDLAREVRAWALEAGTHPLMRIALCGYEGEHDMPGWRCLAWKAHGGYGGGKGNQADVNKHRERIWFSPACNAPRQGRLL